MRFIQIVALLGLLCAQGVTAQLSLHEILSNLTETVMTEISTQCLKDIIDFNILTKTYWLMVDSGARIPSGIAKGNIRPMGNYDECLEISEVETKFCKASLNVNLPVESMGLEKIEAERKIINPEVFGVALPAQSIGISFYYCVFKSCNVKDLNMIFPQFIHFEESQCVSKDSYPELDGIAIFAIFLFAFIALITLLSTIYDIYLNYFESEPIHPLSVAFSLYTNGKKLFHLGNSSQLQCLNGLKSVSMLWVVMGHVYMAFVFVPVDSYVDVYNWLDSTYSQYISGATVSVDTFLVIGGFLTMYTFQTAMDKGTKFNIALYYFHRFLRLTPALAAVVLAHVALFNYFGTGPIWENTEIYLVKPCRKYWWSALLYVQNYANPAGICVPQSWYLSLDMQLFIISPVLLVLMRQWPVWGYITLSGLSLGSIIASFLLGWFFKLGGQMTANLTGNLNDFMKYYYMPTHTRMSPYLFGIMLGYTIYYLKNNKRTLKLNPILVLSAWTVSLGVMATCVYAGHTLQSFDYDQMANSFYIALRRPVWALGVCWVIFACVTGHGKPIDAFLSLPVFQILSRLCYSIYLVHYSFIFMSNFTTRMPLHFSDYYAFHKFVGDFAFTVVIAIFWTLVFESPIITLEKILFGKKTKREKDLAQV